jgi:dienelactone hydrolase
MIRSALLLLMFVFSPSVLAQFSDPVNKTTSRGVNYREIVVSVSTPYESCFLLSCTKKETTVRGLLSLPDEAVHKPPYNLLVRGHSSQDGGSRLRYSIGIYESRLLGIGYAVLYPVRKGFSVNDLPQSDISPDTTEPITTSCTGIETGITSALSDVKAYLNVLATRNDVNLNKIILSGFSRGGIVALALASEGYPGVVGVFNTSGGWMSETLTSGTPYCGASVNEKLFKEFGEKIKVPVFSVYGGNDWYQSESTIRRQLSFLGKHAPSDFVIASGAGHSVNPTGKDLTSYLEKLKTFHQLMGMPY